MALNVQAQAWTFKIIRRSFMSIYNAFHAILYFQNSINRGKWNLLGISLKLIPQNIVLFSRHSEMLSSKQQ